MTELIRQAESVLECKHVIGVGLGQRPDGEPAVLVNVTQKVPLEELDEQDVVPREINGLPTDVIPVGTVRAYAQGGDSIGHVDVTAGTFGCVVKHEGLPVILSNNHVLANSNDAELGDPILSPGPYDGGEFPEDLVGYLEDYVPINFDGLPIPSECPIGNKVADALNWFAKLLGSDTRLLAVKEVADENYVDAAIATPIDEDAIHDDIAGLGPVTGAAEATVGTEVVKSGRTTGVTRGVVTQVNTTIQVQYGAGRVAVMRDQVLSDIFSQPGDSGSAILEDTTNAIVGLLFAGSDTVTVFNRAGRVFNSLNLTL